MTTGGRTARVRYRLDESVPGPVVAPELTPSQERVAAHRGSPLLVLAGPGAGKTTVLVESVVRRVEAGYRSPDSVLLLTFGRRAAQQLRERLSLRLRRPSSGRTAWTFHGFCWATLREHQPERARRLLSSAQADVVLRDLLAGAAEGQGRAAAQFPEALRPALGTRAFAEQVRAFLGGVRSLNHVPGTLADEAARDDLPEVRRQVLRASAALLDEYLEALERQDALDYAQLVGETADLLRSDEQVAAAVRGRWRTVLVDEYQDTDPAQVALLRQLCPPGADVVAVGDPDQAIYRFRGADVDGLGRFPEEFPQADGTPADVVVLEESRRCPPVVLGAARAVRAGLPAPGVPAEALALHRAPRSTRPADDHGGPEPSAEVLVLPGRTAQAEAVADLLRREHLERGTPWQDMAVLVRSAARSVSLLRRVLAERGVPVEVAGDEVPLPQEPAVAGLLTALRAADGLARAAALEVDGRPDDAGRERQDALDVDRVAELLTGPLVGADALHLRRLARRLRAQERAVLAESDAASHLPRPAEVQLRDAVLDRARTAGLPDAVTWPVRRLADLLDGARAALDEGPEAALWSLWQGATRWRTRLVETSEAGGTDGRAADRDLDAVLALFRQVAHRGERGTAATSVAVLLDELASQQIPADPLDETSVRGGAVRLLTAHRAKGLEWEVVVVADVVDGVWPDVRRRDVLLADDGLGEVRPPGAAGRGSGRRDREPVGRADLADDERRLFFVALTRARRRLVVTAVAEPAEDGARPSPYVGRLRAVPGIRWTDAAPAAHDGGPAEESPAADDPTAPAAVGGRPLTWAAVVAGYRRLLADPDVGEQARDVAAARLARLAALRHDDGVPVVAAADPARWWGTGARTVDGRPVVGDGPVPLSASQLKGADECALKVFLERRVRAERPSGTAQGFGLVLHAVAKEMVDGATPAEVGAVMNRVRAVWDELGHESTWRRDQLLEQATDAVERLVAWHLSRAASAREVRAEVAFEATVPVETRHGVREVLLRGSADRLEIDEDGRVLVVDLKTGKTKPSGTEVERDLQLATYQAVVRAGGIELGDRPAGAQLVQLRHEKGGAVVVQEQAAPDDDARFLDAARSVVEQLVDERVPARPQTGPCRFCQFRPVCPAQPESRQVVA